MSQVAENERQLKVVVPKEMRLAIKMQAAGREITIREFVEHALECALEKVQQEKEVSQNRSKKPPEPTAARPRARR